MSEILKANQLNVALVGYPNSGKTTLYNWLTGSKYKTVNYPGSTVEYSVGRLLPHLSKQDQYEVHLIDTPGIYSLSPQTADEQVTISVLKNKKLNVHLVLLVIDITQLSRQMHLVKQLKSSGTPFKIVFTMTDILAHGKHKIDLDKIKDIFKVDLVSFEGVFGKGLNEVVKYFNADQLNQFSVSQSSFEAWDKSKQIENNKWVQQILTEIKYQRADQTILRSTMAIDRYLLHPVFGLVFFFLTMTLLFSSIYWLAAPFMDGIEAGFTFIAEFIKSNMTGLVGDFLADGIVAAVGGVVIFVPQIFILFTLMYILESSGYLARVAAIIDKPMSMIGLGGRSFVPMLSGFGCAIPAIIATRNISSRKEKILAQSLIPLLTCSARIPVYSLMLGFLIGEDSYILTGFCMAALYLASIVVSGVVSGILSRIIYSQEAPKLMMDFPLYRKPKLKVILAYGLDHSKSFLKRAGPIIFVLSILIWFATNFPRTDAFDGDVSHIAQQSYAAQLGQAIEPVFKPMGLDWRVGFGIISAFAAREVFVSSLAIIFNAEGEDDVQVMGLIEKMRKATFPDGAPVFTLGSSLGLIVFFMIARQCLATFAILRKETGHFSIATTQLLLSNIFAYTLAVGINYIFT
jgi:ferrous iron transport protein B